jgi:hypothetical protein
MIRLPGNESRTVTRAKPSLLDCSAESLLNKRCIFKGYGLEDPVSSFSVDRAPSLRAYREGISLIIHQGGT